MAPTARPRVHGERKFALGRLEGGVNERIGELLVKEKRISAEQLNEARSQRQAELAERRFRSGTGSLLNWIDARSAEELTDGLGPQLRGTVFG